MNEPSSKEKQDAVGFLNRLNQNLMAMVNNKVGFRAKEHLSNIRDYAYLRAKKEEEVVLTTNWFSLFDACDWINEPIGDISEYSDSNLAILQLIVIQALKGSIDSREERSSNCQTLYARYKKPKTELVRRGIDEKGDSYQTYLAEREAREQERTLLEQTRYTGSMCPYCHSTKVKSIDFALPE